MNKNKFDFCSSTSGLTHEQSQKLTELMAVLDKANNQLKNLISGVGDKVDTRERTPMGEVFKSFKSMDSEKFINWLSINLYGLLNKEREMIEDTFDTGYGDDSTGSHFFDSLYKQTL